MLTPDLELALSELAVSIELALALPAPFVSVKTVDYHLQNVYRKLNLRSRTELAVRVSQATPN